MAVAAEGVVSSRVLAAGATRTFRTQQNGPVPPRGELARLRFLFASDFYFSFTRFREERPRYGRARSTRGVLGGRYSLRIPINGLR